MKKICIAIYALLMCLVGMISVSAASDRVQIVSSPKQYNILTNTNKVTAKLRQTILVNESDLVTGDITVQVDFINANDTEIIYVIDNNANFASKKENTIEYINNLNEVIVASLDSDFVKIGAIFTTNGNEVIKALSNNINDITTNINSLANIISEGTGGYLEDATDLANETFSNSTTVNKVLVVITPDNTYVNNGANIVYTSSGTLQTDIETSLLNRINQTLVNQKNNASIVLPISSNITDNFNVTLVNPGTAVSMENNVIAWNIGTVLINDVSTMKYKLSLKEAVDESKIGYELLVNEAPTIRFNGSVAKDTSNTCAISIKLLNESVDNPKTGIVNYIIFGSVIMAVGAISYIVTSKRKLLNTI